MNEYNDNNYQTQNSSDGEGQYVYSQTPNLNNSNPSRAWSVAALVLGIVGICLSFIPIVNNTVFLIGILAIIFGAISCAKKIETKPAITGIVLGALAIVIAFAIQIILLIGIFGAVDEMDDDLGIDFGYLEEELAYGSGDKTDEILDQYLDVEIGKFQVIKHEYYDDTKLEVVVRNKGSETSSFTIKIEAIDEEGYRLGYEYIYVNDLGAGLGEKFEIFKYVSSDKIEQYKKATFKIVEVTKSNY